MDTQDFVEKILWNSIESDNQKVREAGIKKLAAFYKEKINSKVPEKCYCCGAPITCSVSHIKPAN